jgi:hypothetical protein
MARHRVRRLPVFLIGMLAQADLAEHAPETAAAQGVVGEAPQPSPRARPAHGTSPR